MHFEGILKGYLKAVAGGSSIRKGRATATVVRSKSVRLGPVSGLFLIHATGPLNTTYCLILPIPSLLHQPSLTQTSTLSLHNSRPTILFKLFLHAFIASFLLLHFQFFPTLWIASIFTSVSPSFNLQMQMLGFPCLWSVSVPHPWFQQKVDQRQYQHILILCWCMLWTLMRISIPKGLTRRCVVNWLLASFSVI